MPHKDNEDNRRERKKSKKWKHKDGIYSSKHIRIMEERCTTQNKKLK